MAININNVVLVGRITKDPELHQTAGVQPVPACRFTLAIDRKGNKQNDAEGKPTADFVQVVAYRQSATFLCQYGAKGNVVSVEGRIQTRNYDGPSGKVYVTEVVAESVQIISNRNSVTNGMVNPGVMPQGYQQANPQGYTPQGYPQAPQGYQAPPVQPVQQVQQPLPQMPQNQGQGGQEIPTLDISSDDLPFY